MQIHSMLRGRLGKIDLIGEILILRIHVLISEDSVDGKFIIVLYLIQKI